MDEAVVKTLLQQQLARLSMPSSRLLDFPDFQGSQGFQDFPNDSLNLACTPIACDGAPLGRTIQLIHRPAANPEVIHGHPRNLRHYRYRLGPEAPGSQKAISAASLAPASPSSSFVFPQYCITFYLSIFQSCAVINRCEYCRFDSRCNIFIILFSLDRSSFINLIR